MLLQVITLIILVSRRPQLDELGNKFQRRMLLTIAALYRGTVRTLKQNLLIPSPKGPQEEVQRVSERSVAISQGEHHTVNA